MKRIFIGVLIFNLLFFNIGCQNKDENIDNDLGQGVHVNKKDNIIEINIPVELSEEIREFNRDNIMLEEGFEDFQVREDGSVQILMTREKHFEMMQYLEMDLIHMIEELIQGEDTPYIMDISHNPGYSHLDILVDREQYDQALDLSPLVLGMTAGVYQVYDGGDFNVEVRVEDYKSGEELLKVNYPDIFYQ